MRGIESWIHGEILLRPRVTGGDLGRGTHGWRSLRTRGMVGGSGRGMTGPESWLEKPKD
jgi:hypothetical protein